MTELADLDIKDEAFQISFRDERGTFSVSLSQQTASVLVAWLAQGVVDRADSNRPGISWLRWPTTVRTQEVSFDIESIGSGLVGMAVKLPGLMPIALEIPPTSARQIGAALNEAADKSDVPQVEES